MRSHFMNIRSYGKYKSRCVANRDVSLWVNVTPQIVAVIISGIIEALTPLLPHIHDFRDVFAQY
jgi:hypothetical protein